MSKSNAKETLLGIFYVCVALVGLVLSTIIFEFIYSIAIVLIVYVALPIAVIGAIVGLIIYLINHFNKKRYCSKEKTMSITWKLEILRVVLPSRIRATP